MSEGKIRFFYARTGVGVFLSHLDALNVLKRALRRSGLPYQITGGFHPRPHMSFSPPLPLGHSSSCEVFDVVLQQEVEADEAGQRFGPQLPTGFQLLQTLKLSAQTPSLMGNSGVRYRIQCRKIPGELRLGVVAFFRDPEKQIVTKKGDEVKTYFLRNALRSFSEMETPENWEFILEFWQGKPDMPSASKILTQFLDEMGDWKEGIADIERIAFFPTE